MKGKPRKKPNPACRAKKHITSIINLPSEVLLLVTNYLDYTDASCLALTCKHL